MRSKANIKGHPIHPILVSFPIAFFTGAFILDLIYLMTESKNYFQAGIYLTSGGIIFGVLAAIPGIIDYIFTIPPKSSANQRATNHGLLNSTVIIIFIITLLLRTKSDINLFVIIGLEGIGIILLSISGWMGGTLIVRNQISIDHRYANAGKWNEEKINTSLNSIELKDLDKLGINQMKLVLINGKRIVIARTESENVAFDDYCSHRGGSLADGVIICGTVQCPWHGSQFDVKTGTVKAGPANDPISTYRIEVNNQKYFLHFEHKSNKS
jgi:uncharacterized membrane protein/nitrite reductase/ring-hydroxylating ferredoxin subunit